MNYGRVPYYFIKDKGYLLNKRNKYFVKFYDLLTVGNSLRVFDNILFSKTTKMFHWDPDLKEILTDLHTVYSVISSVLSVFVSFVSGTISHGFFFQLGFLRLVQLRE
jgi:hypothetical protein